MGYKGRDVEVSMLDNDLCLVAACDSCGAIGDKELDQLNVPSWIVGQMTARAVLLEVLCTGALPMIMTVAICTEPEPAGKEILKGVHAELAASGFTDLPLAVSTEKNFKTRQTGLGISVTGVCKTKALKIAKSQPGDRVYCLGLPKVGKEVLAKGNLEVVNAGKIEILLKQKDIHDILPVGSKGILVEADQLAQNTNSIFKPDNNPLPDLNKSAGPSTCIIFTSNAEQNTTRFGKLPLSEVGIFI
ncbi:hypothetical protein [Desulfobacula sp.]